jgi:beta-mannosidase
VDPANTEAFVGCFRDGNPWWGGAQHALPFLASGPDTTMTVSSCIALCAKAGSNHTLAGVQKGGWCYCGTEIGQTCEGCLRGTGTPADPSECGWPCDGDPSVACGGATYMWNSNSVYNVTHASATVSAAGRIPPPPPPPGAEGSGNSGFAVVINGVKIFSRGGNLVPFELLESTVDPNYIKRTVKSAVDGNMNMIRIWGGGIYQADSFYEACDEAGVMLFHDMMFSFRLYPHDPAFEANVAAEVDYQVTRLLHHPSIVLWDSSNENEGDPAFFYRIVLDRIAAIDTNRPLWPASPSSGFSAGVHTDTGLPNGNPLVGRYQQTLDTHMPYGYCSAAFMTSTTLNQTLNPSQPGNPMVYFKSEFGQVSLPAFETLAPVLSETDGDYGIFSDIMVHRKHSTQKDLADPITSLFGFDNFKDTSAANFRRVIFLSQLAQMLCIKTTLEELRRGDETFGALMWQLNDVWQASSWGSLDYGGRWRALQHSLQAVFAPTLVSLWLDHASGTAQVYGSHHGAVESGLAIEVNVTSIVTGKVSSHVLKNWSAPGTAFVAPVGQVPLDTISMKHEVIVTQLIKDGVPVETSLTVHPLLPPTEMDWSIASISDVTTTVSSDLTVVVENGATAPLFYTLVTSTLPGRFSRNLLFIPPKESVHLVFYFANESGAVPTPTPAELRASLSMDWYNRM